GRCRWARVAGGGARRARARRERGRALGGGHLRRGRGALLEGRETGLDLDGLAGRLELGELRVDARRRDLGLTDRLRLLAAHDLLVARDLARRVEHVDRADRALHGLLGLRALLPRDERVALRPQLAELVLHHREARLELLDRLALRGDERLGLAHLGLGGDLLAERDLGEVVELVRVRRVALLAVAVRLRGRGSGLLAPLLDGGDVLVVVLLREAQVADGLRHRLLRVGDVVRVVPHELVQHLLRVLRAVEERVDVRARELRDPSEDALLLRHGRPSLVNRLVLVGAVWCRPSVGRGPVRASWCQKRPPRPERPPDDRPPERPPDRPPPNPPPP